MLIDCHVHLNNYVDNPGRPTKENVQTLFDKMAEHGVDHAVVLTSYKVDVDRPSVEEVLEALASDPRTRRDETKANISWRTAARLFRIPMEDLLQGPSHGDPGPGPKA